MKTGRPIETDITRTRARARRSTVYPSILGGKNWEPMSFNPQTGIAYANTLAFGGHYKTEPVDLQGRRMVSRHGPHRSLGVAGDGPRGHLKAIDPLTGKTKWEAPSDIPRFSGVLVDRRRRRLLRPVDRRVRSL